MFCLWGVSDTAFALSSSILFLSRYMLAEGLGLSGIVSILFTGIVSEAMKVFIFFFCV